MASASTNTNARENKDAKKQPFAFSVDTDSADTDSKGAHTSFATFATFTAALTEARKLRAQTVQKPYLSVNDAKFDQLCTDYIAWRQSLCTGFAGHFRTRLRTDKQVALCKRNTRFVLGLLALLGMDDVDPETGMSLGLLAIEDICKAVLAVFDARGIRSQRRYQLAGELRHILAFVFERAHAGKSAKEKSAAKIDTLAAYNMVQAVLRESAHDKKIESRKALSKDEDELIAEGKALSQEDRDLLQTKLESYLSKNASPGEDTSKKDVFRFQAYLLTYILNANIIPVVRSEILCTLKVGKNFKLDDKARQYVIDTGNAGGFEASKTKEPVFIKFPSSETALLTRWLDEWRPLLLPSKPTNAGAKGTGKSDCGYVFLTIDGHPRSEITHCVKGVQRELIGVSVSAHCFRRMQATESKRVNKNGLDKATEEAMARGRQHTPAVAARFYAKVNRKREADLASDHLADLRSASKKRRLSPPRSSRASRSPAPAPEVKASLNVDCGPDVVHVSIKQEPQDRDDAEMVDAAPLDVPVTVKIEQNSSCTRNGKSASGEQLTGGKRARDAGAVVEDVIVID